MQAAPDGYTLLMVTTSNATNPGMYRHLNYDFLHDIAPIAGVIRVGQVMEVNPAVPAKTVPEFIAYAKANPGKINMASGGIGSTPHLAGELFKMMAGIDLVHVPYHGDAPALIDMAGGRVQVMFDLISASIGFIKSGKLRALAVTARRARRRCQICRRSPISCPAMKPHRSRASARRRTRRKTLSTS